MGLGLKRMVRKHMRKRRLRPPRWSLPLDERGMRDSLNGVGRNDVVVDLGAHEGVFTVEAACVASHVYAFEPHPEIFKILKENTSSYQNITLFNAAAGSFDGTAQFYLDGRPDGLGEGSTLKDGKSDMSVAGMQDVQVIDFGGFISSLGCDVSLLKIDIEGSEYDVINSLIDHDVVGKLRRVTVEDHCRFFEGLAEHKALVVERLRRLGQLNKFDFDWH